MVTKKLFFSLMQVTSLNFENAISLFESTFAQWVLKINLA